MIKNIVFDFGGVLLDLRPDRCIEEFRKIGIPEVEDMLSVAHQQGVLGDMEEGKLSLSAFCDGIRASHTGIFTSGSRSLRHPFMKNGHPIPAPTNRQIVLAFCSMADGLPAYKLDFCQQLKDEGFHVSALSNTNPVHWGYCQRYFVEAGYCAEELFEYVWLSCDMHLVKPDPRIFEAILAESGYKAEETLFVDDNAKNCDVARQLGIHAFQAPIRTDWSTELRRQLIAL